MKKWLLPIGIIVIVVIAVVAFISVGSESPSSTGEAKKVGEVDTNQQSQEETQVQSEFKVGDKIEFEKRILTVSSVKRNYVESSEFALTPEAGKEFILVNVTIENNSDSPISFGEFDFKVEDSKGVRKSSAYVGEIKNQLDYGDLAIGGKVTGNLPFEVSKGEKGLKLLFNPSFWSDKEVKVSLD